MDLRHDPRTGIHIDPTQSLKSVTVLHPSPTHMISVDIPIHTLPRQPRPDPLCTKPQPLEHRDVPRLETRRTEQNTSCEFQGPIERLDLDFRLLASWIEPIHGVHDDGDGEALGRDAGDDFVDFVGVDTEVFEGARPGEFGVGAGGEVGWVAAGI